MNITEIIIAIFLGCIEGITEFLPVSSTAHLLLLSHFFNFSTHGKVFEVLIQLGAIMAIIMVYYKKIWYLITHFHSDNQARHLVFGVLIAFIPAVVIGLFMHSIIKSIFFESPLLICVTLIVGGVILWWVDQLDLKPHYQKAEEYSFKTCLIIGLCQCLAMIPGTSRSGATIVSAMLLGSDKRTAAEFSFFLALPTMMGAFSLDLYKNYDLITQNDIFLVVIGFITSFITGFIVVKKLLGYVSHYGFSLFAYWRMIVGSIGLVFLMFL